MNIWSARRGGIVLAVSFVVSGCSATPSGTIPGIAGAALQRHGAAWMAPGLASVALVYVTNQDGLVNVYNGTTHKLVGILTDFNDPMGECVDKSGDVYITDYQAEAIYEYAHGGAKPINTIDESYQPYGCAVDSKTGNLAVANYGQTYGSKTSSPRPDYVGDGNIAIYAHAKGNPTYYGTRTQHFTACGYDKYGDLLAAAQDGFSGYYGTDFDYLDGRTKKFATISLPGPKSSWYWGAIDAIAWDGKYFDVDSRGVYRYSINIKPIYYDTLALNNAGDLGAVALYRSTLGAAPSQIVGVSDEASGTGYLTYWKFPAGGDPLEQSSKYLDNPYGVAVSPGS